jgi:quercetin dioxygenase-like cupin family protein
VTDVAAFRALNCAFNSSGESFFEPAGSQHLVSENGSTKEPASLLAIFIADGGARLTTFDK